MEPWDRGVESFPTTHWSLLAGLRDGMAPENRIALGQLLQRYLPALRAHLTAHRGLGQDAADDLLQDFVVSKFLEDSLLVHARQGLGRFRAFLVVSLDNFWRNKRREQSARKRSPGQGQLQARDDLANVAVDGMQPSEAFNREWARNLIAEALRRMRSECQAAGREDLWALFECRVVAPTLEGAAPVAYEELIRRFAFRSPSQAFSALATAKRMFARVIRSLLAEYARDEAEIDSELRELHQAVSRAENVRM